MSHARMKTVFFFYHFSKYLPWSIFLIAAAVGKLGFLPCFLSVCLSVFLISQYCNLELSDRLGISSCRL